MVQPFNYMFISLASDIVFCVCVIFFQISNHILRRYEMYVILFLCHCIPSTGATLNAGVTLNTSLKQTLFSVKCFSRPRAVSY